MNNEDILISKLLEETCSSDLEDSEKDSNLYDYFEKKVNQVEFLSIEKYLEQQTLLGIDFSYNEKNKCFRLVYDNKTLDFPSNWGVFGQLKNNSSLFIYSENDEDFLCDIFTEAFKECNGLVLSADNQKYKLILVDANTEEHFKWFQSYFNKKYENQEIKKAS